MYHLKFLNIYFAQQYQYRTFYVHARLGYLRFYTPGCIQFGVCNYLYSPVKKSYKSIMKSLDYLKIILLQNIGPTDDLLRLYSKSSTIQGKAFHESTDMTLQKTQVHELLPVDIQ